MDKMLVFLAERKRRIGMSLFGVIICAISVGIFKIAALGALVFKRLKVHFADVL